MDCFVRTARGVRTRIEIDNERLLSKVAQANFKAKYEVPFDLLADVKSAICDAFGVIVEKNMYGKKSLGIQRSTFLIQDGVVTKVWPKVKVAGHAAEVLSSL